MALKGFRTVVANLLMAAVPVLEASGLVAVLPPDALPYYLVGMAVANILLRMVTDTPVGKDKPKAAEPGDA